MKPKGSLLRIPAQLVSDLFFIPWGMRCPGERTNEPAALIPLLSWYAAEVLGRTSGPLISSKYCVESDCYLVRFLEAEDGGDEVLSEQEMKQYWLWVHLQQTKTPR